MLTTQHQGKTYFHAVAVGRALGLTGSNAGQLAAVLAAMPASAKVESLSGDLYLDVERLPISADARPGFEARLAAVRPLDLAAGAVVHRPFADARPQVVAGPSVGSPDATRSNARAFLGKSAAKPQGSYLDRAAKRVAELRASPGTAAHGAARPASAGNDAASLANAFGLDPANAAKLAAATVAPVKAAAPVKAGLPSEADYLAQDGHLAGMPAGPERDQYRAAVLANARRRGLIAA